MCFLVLTLLLALVGFSSADYQIGVAVQSIEFLEPQNTLADGSCCDSGCGDDATCCAAASCSPTLRLCFRKSQHPTDDRDSPCLVQISREDGDEPFFSLSTDSPAAAGYYTGGFQVYVRIAHFNGEFDVDFDPPFRDPLIDELFLEYTVPAVEFDQRFSAVTQVITSLGDFGRVEITLRVSVHCAVNWIGPGCESLCTTSSNCMQVLFSPTTSTTTSSTTIEARPTTPSMSPLVTPPDSIVPIAVGVSVGLVVLILVLTCLVILIIVVCIKSRTWRKEWSPSTVPYAIKPRQKVDDVHVEGLDEPEVLYTPVMKRKNNDGGMGHDGAEELPPPVPPYNGGDDSDSDLGSETQGITVVFQNDELNGSTSGSGSEVEWRQD